MKISNHGVYYLKFEAWFNKNIYITMINFKFFICIFCQTSDSFKCANGGRPYRYYSSTFSFSTINFVYVLLCQFDPLTMHSMILHTFRLYRKECTKTYMQGNFSKLNSFVF